MASPPPHHGYGTLAAWSRTTLIPSKIPVLMLAGLNLHRQPRRPRTLPIMP
jgi:hypothetical protein